MGRGSRPVRRRRQRRSPVVDQRPGNHGRVGEFFHEEGLNFARWPATLVELLEQTATALETGQTGGGLRTTVEDGYLVWD